ncbi:phytoene desaturase family protein [Actinokineospora bangkokensis]|uniref:Phytoene dehydrogenase n=1 Tax=Actinokineospora bangkokensis TaxID=1193682 RepID=A0A1Q9LPG8_9PSEU|nr:phytoene desaturase family protein [Actinokineospora bangkokensis]OLR93918.1 phytoene dehydrogenase [Actinokineospora bangkokensis]
MRTVSGRTDRVVVVGAGLSGLAAALHLAGRGREVTVVEREPVPGGRAGRHDMGGFRVDTGPTVLTMPDLLDEAFAAVGDSLAARLDLLPLAPAYRAHFADGSRLDVHSDRDAMAAEVLAVCGPEQERGYLRLREWLTKLYRVQYDRFIAANFDSPLSLVSGDLARLVAMGGFGRLDKAIGRFVSDERLQRVFSFQALYAGESPQRALAVYAVIAYMDTIAGVYFPRGGMRAVPDALAAAAADAGVTFAYERRVTGLEKQGDRVTAVTTAGGERFPCDAVVLTTEPDFSYDLLGRTPRRPTGLRAAPSAVVVHLGTDRTWADAAHHSISFGGEWERTFTEIIREGRTMSDPSLLITRPTASDPALAPAGKDLLYVLAPVPNRRAGALDWEREGKAYAEEVVSVAERRLYPGLAASVEATHLVTPAEWAAMGLTDGTPFSYAHSLTQTGPFRPGNFPRSTANAVLAGSGTVPGVGVPTALVSGKLAADRVTGSR